MTGGRTGRGPQQTKLDKFTRQKDTLSGSLPDAHESQQSLADTAAVEPSLADIMTAIQGIQVTLEGKMDSISTEVNLLRADFGKMKERIKDNQGAVTMLQSENKDLKSQVMELQKTTDKIVDKLDEYEGRMRRNNIRITGVPEKMEGPTVDLFVEELVSKRLKARGLSKYFSVERAHRVPGGRPRPGAPPRTIIARIFNFRDRDVILQEARKNPPVRIDNATISFFPDFTLRVQNQRRDFLAVKKRMRDQGLKYSMLFPARLRVVTNNRTLFFDAPEEAWDWMDRRESQEAGRGDSVRKQQQSSPDKSKTDPDKGETARCPSPPVGSTETPEAAPGERLDWFDGVG